MTIEIWRTTPLAPDFIEVSSLGRVRTKERLCVGIVSQMRPAHIFSPSILSHGYKVIAIKTGPKRPKYLVHRLVAAAFCDGDSSLTVDHVNGDRLDNRPENLQFVTLAENTRRQWASGRVRLRGETNPKAKLTTAAVNLVKQRVASGERIIEIANHFGVSVSLIYKIAQGRKRIAG